MPHHHRRDVKGKDAPREIELKLETDAAGMAAAIRAAPIAAAGRPRSVSMTATYFDTPDCRLARGGATLRIRREGRRHIQTVKSAAVARAGFADRREEAVPVKGNTPDLEAAAAGGLAELLAEPAVAASIRPAFTVTVRRRTVTVTMPAGVVEAAFDQGTVAADGRLAPIGEVELELKAGAPAALFELALALAEAAPLRLSTLPKSARGYALLGVKSAAPEPRRLRRRMPAGDAFAAIAGGCLAQFGAAEAAFRGKPGARPLHQMRVALRRLRAALKLFDRVTEDEARAGIDAELAWMAGTLGAARDLDVTIAGIADPAVARHPGDAEFAALREALQARRDAAYRTAEAAIDSPRFRRGVIAAAAWVETGAWRQTDEAKAVRRRRRRLAVHAAREMKRRWHGVRQGGEHLAELPPQDRHRLRIKVKKLRYAAEFFTPLFRGGGNRRRCRRARNLLETLQDRLGGLHDLDVLDERAGGIAGVARLKEEEAARAASLLDEAVAAAAALARIRPFWD
jgi:inorganic triphosphatase YgiF